MTSSSLVLTSPVANSFWLLNQFITPVTWAPVTGPAAACNVTLTLLRSTTNSRTRAVTETPLLTLGSAPASARSFSGYALPSTIGGISCSSTPPTCGVTYFVRAQSQCGDKVVARAPAVGLFELRPAPLLPSISVTGPTEGTVWVVNSTGTGSWSVVNIASLSALTDGAGYAQLDLVYGSPAGSTSGAAAAYTLQTTLAVGLDVAGGLSTLTVTVPDVPARTNYRLALYFPAFPTIGTVYSAPFSVHPPAPPPPAPPLIVVSAPAAGASYVLGATVPLAWSARGASAGVSISLATTDANGEPLMTALSAYTPTTSQLFSWASSAAALPAGATASASKPFWFVVADAADATLFGQSPVFYLTPAAPPPSPTLTVTTPGSVDTWVVTRTPGSDVGGGLSGVVSGGFLVAWTSSALPDGSLVSVTLQYRQKAGLDATALTPPSWSTAVLLMHAPAGAANVSVGVPDSVPISTSAAYLYRVAVTWERPAGSTASDVSNSGDNFNIISTVQQPQGGGDPIPSSAITVSPTPSAAADPLPTPGTTEEPPAPPPAPALPALSIGFAVSAPLAGSTFFLGAGEAPIVARWTLNASIPNALGGVNVTLVRRLASGDYTTVAALASGLRADAGELSLSITDSDLIASLLSTSGYALRLEVSAPAYNASAAAESGSFTLSRRPRLTLTSPSAGDFTEGDTITVAWTSFNVEGGLRLEMVDATGTAIGAPIVQDVDAAPTSGAASYSFTAATTWGSSMPLRVRASSQARPDVFSVSPTIRILRQPWWLEITTTTVASPTMNIFEGPNTRVAITWDQSDALRNTEDNGEITLRCSGLPAIAPVTLTPQQLVAGTFEWAPVAGEPAAFDPTTETGAAFTTARSCVLRVRAVNRPDIFHDSTAFGLVRPSQPSLRLTAPAPSNSGVTAAVGAAFPLTWTANRCAGVVTVALESAGDDASAGVPRWVTAPDVSTGAMPGLIVPLTTPAGSYNLVLLSASAASASTTVRSLPQAITIAPPAFTFSTLPAVVTTGSTLNVAFTTALPCGTLITLSVLASTTSGASVISAFSDPSFTACAPLIAIPIPADLDVGDYQLQASSPAVPSLARTSSVFRVQAPTSVTVTYPTVGTTLSAGGATTITWNTTGYTITSRLVVSLLRCPAAWKTATAAPTAANALVSCTNYTLSGGEGVQNLQVLPWSILPLMEPNLAWPPAAEASYFIRITSLVNPTSAPAFSAPFTITPAPSNVIVHVTVAPLSNSRLLCHTPDPARVSWTVLGGSTQYALELWQERFYYTGGDALLLNVTGDTPVLALDGPYNYLWQNLPTSLSSVEPVYLRVIAVSGPYTGTWGRSDVFYLDSAPSPGLPDFQTRYCGGGAAPAAWAALCASNCADCAARSGTWATGSHVTLSFVQPTDSAMGTVELQRLSNTLGAFEQTTGVCLPAGARRATSSDTSSEVPPSSVAPFRVELGLLPGMAAQLAALKPDGALTANLTANMFVVPADLSATCEDVSTLVVTNIDITVPVGNVSGVISGVQGAFSNVTNVGSSSSVVVIGDQTAGSGTSSSGSSGAGGGRRRQLAAPHAALGHDSHTSSCRSGRRLQLEVVHPAAAAPLPLPLVLPGVSVMSLALGEAPPPAPREPLGGSVTAFFRGGAGARALGATSPPAPTAVPKVTLAVTVTTVAGSPAQADSMVAMLEAAQKAGRLPGTITSSTVQPPSVLAAAATSASAPAPLYAPALEENRAFAGVGNSAQETTSYTSTDWKDLWKARIAKVWATIKAYVQYLYNLALDNLFILIITPFVIMLFGWCVTTYFDAPRRAKWLKAMAAREVRKSSRFCCCGERDQPNPIAGHNGVLRHAAFQAADIGDWVGIRGPDGALSPQQEPFFYVQVYEWVLRLLAATQLPVLRNWAPVPRPFQDASADQRVKHLQPFKVGNVLSSTEAAHVAAARTGFEPKHAAHANTEGHHHYHHASPQATLANPLHANRHSGQKPY